MNLELYISDLDKINGYSAEHWVTNKGVLFHDGKLSDINSIIEYIQTGQKLEISSS